MRKGLGARLLSRLRCKGQPEKTQLCNLSTDELLGLLRHETHRIEKAVYNDILETKRIHFEAKRARIAEILEILSGRGLGSEEPTIGWSASVYDAFENLEMDYVRRHSLPAPDCSLEPGRSFLGLVKRRRSVRVWAAEQPANAEFDSVLEQMIDAARWAPNSGNRQALRFLVLRTEEEKGLLCGLKEGHCVSAPVLVFVGADTRLYGALGPDERCVYLDAGAAIMQMMLVAHVCGLGTCWNHLVDDLIQSRAANVEIYHRFAQALDVPEYITPIAVVAVGVAAFTPPTPARMNLEAFCLGRGRERSTHCHAAP